MKPQFLIGAEGAGRGKTVFAMTLALALGKRGFDVQCFKCGPHSTDARLLSLVCDVPAVNLDPWMASPNHLQSVYNSYGEKADVCMVEGEKGLFDGFNCMKGSGADMARVLQLPVVLLIDARSASYSVAAVIYGFRNYRRSVPIAGVVFSQVASSGHYAYLRQACSDAGVECLGYLPVFPELELPVAHQGVPLAVRQSLLSRLHSAANVVAQTVEIDKLLALVTRGFPCPYTLPYTSDNEPEEPMQTCMTGTSRLQIAVARDSAFFSIYQENLDRLSCWGDLTYFSPLHARVLPPADLYYFPGGCVELYARQLYRNRSLLQSLRDAAEKGVRMLAEGSAVALLAESLTSKSGQVEYEMAGVLPLKCVADYARMHYGYRRLNFRSLVLRGYEAMHIDCVAATGRLSGQDVALSDVKGRPVETLFYRYKQVIASFPQWYWGEEEVLKLW